MLTFNECWALGWSRAWQGEDRGRAHAKSKITCSLFLWESKHTVGVVLTLPGEGSALGRLGVGVQVLGRLGIGVQVLGRLGTGVQVLGNFQARGWGDTSNSILHSRLFGSRGVRGLGSHFRPNRKC